jgi:chromosome segregation ATPase
MALTRKLLKGMCLTDEQVDTIIEAHTDTVDGLKADVSKYKTDAEKLTDVQKELDDLKAKGDDGWKEKHNKLKGEFDTYKKDVEAKETHSKKVEAYKTILKDAGLSEKGIEKAIKYAEWDKIELEADGKLKGASDHIKSVKEEWAEYVTTTTTTGAKTSNPPANNGGSGNGKTREEILAIKDGSVHRMEMAKNAHLFPEMPAATN